MKNRNLLVALLVVMIFSNIAFFTVGYNVAAGNQQDELPPIDNVDSDFLNKVQRITNIIDQYYFNEYNWDEIEEHIYRQLIEALNDPYSEYLSPQDLENLEIRSGRSYGGIGVEVTMNNGVVTVVTPMEGSPGQRAGLLPGDKILEVDGVNVEGMGLSDVVDLIRGEPDSEVILGIFREGRQDIIRVPIIRGVITTTAVESRILENQLGYLKLTRFSEGADAEFAKALENLKKQGMTELIIDLRGNPGGYLHTVLNIAQLVVPQGEVVYMEDKHGNRVRTYNSDLQERDFDVVVLIDGNSASASEILAGALKDNDAATLIGEKTFGKGSVQSLLDLRDGSAVKLTIQKYFTPSGVVIDGVGVSPDIAVEQPEEANYPNLTYKSQLSKGSTGIDVIILNNILHYLGYTSDLTQDSIFTEETKNNVEKFQRDNGLPVTGIVNLNTSDKLNQRFTNLKKQKDYQLNRAIEFFKNN